MQEEEELDLKKVSFMGNNDLIQEPNHEKSYEVSVHNSLEPLFLPFSLPLGKLNPWS
jgi:hypothetical protein